MASDTWEDLRIADEEYRRANPRELSTSECAGRAADEQDSDRSFVVPISLWPTSRYWPTGGAA
jgi:hypothetical protein